MCAHAISPTKRSNTDLTLPEILFEDNHLLCVNKPVSALVQADKTGDESLPELLKKYIARKYNKPGEVYLGIVHRLDRPVSGVLLFARTSKAAARLSEQFQLHSTRKIYWAVVEGAPAADHGTLVNLLWKNESQNKSYVTDRDKPGAKEARLNFRVLKRGNRYTLVEVDLLTGRHHQIRAQLAHLGTPIRGDLKYGAARSLPGGGIALHARSLTFQHPTSKQTHTLVANPPANPAWNWLGDVANLSA